MLNLAKIHEIVGGKFSSHWECVSCMKEKSRLTSLDNREIAKESFNSNFESKCQIASNYSLRQEEFIFKCQSADTKMEEKCCSIIVEKDNLIDIFSL